MLSRRRALSTRLSLWKAQPLFWLMKIFYLRQQKDKHCRLGISLLGKFIHISLEVSQLTCQRWSESWAVVNMEHWFLHDALGAAIRDAMLVVVFANILCAVVICLNCRAASRYHIGYPVLSRVTFGIYGSYFVVILRAILGIIWACFSTLNISNSWLIIFPGRSSTLF